MHYSALFWHQYSPRIVFSQTFETLQMCSIRVALTAALWCDFESWQCCYQFTGLVKSINSKPCIWKKLLNIFKQTLTWFSFLNIVFLWLMTPWLRCDVCSILHELTSWGVTFGDTDDDKTKRGVEMGRNMIWVKRHHILFQHEAWLILWEKDIVLTWI